MKKFFYIIIAACFFVACKSDKKENGAQGEKNLAAASAVHKSVESGDVSKLGDYIAADAVDHAGKNGDIKGLDSIKTELAKYKEMSTDMKSEITKEMGDNDYTFQWMRFTGTASTADMGMPVGTKYNMTAIHVCKFKDGMIVEHWEFRQPVDLMKMMPRQPMDNKDSTKM